MFHLHRKIIRKEDLQASRHTTIICEINSLSHSSKFELAREPAHISVYLTRRVTNLAILINLLINL